jgi:hypothetical protein
MAIGVPPDVREIVARVCARNDVLDACRHRDLGTVIAVLGTHGVYKGVSPPLRASLKVG